MKKSNIAVLSIIALLLSTSLIQLQVASGLSDYPTNESPTLMTSLSPPNANLGDNVTWLIWTDPNCAGSEVHLEIYDITNDTIIYDANENLSTSNECGSLKKVMSTEGFQKHEYQFTASMVIDGTKIESLEFLNFEVERFHISASLQPYSAMPGDTIKLYISELIYPFVNALANVTVSNETNPTIWTLTNITIPSANGSRLIDVPTAGLIAGNYDVNVTVISASGADSIVSSFTLLDLIVTVDKALYYIGNMVNVSIRTYPTISEVSIRIYSPYPFLVTPVDEYVSLTEGRAYKLYNSSSWQPRVYVVWCNVTIDTKTVAASSSFTLKPFAVDVECNKYKYVAGEIVNINVSTAPSQPSVEFNLTITNSTMDEIWSYGPSDLDENGTATVTFNTSSLSPDSYRITAVVNNTQYSESSFTTFTIFVPTFNIYASVKPSTNSGYTMPHLNLTVVPEQLNAKLKVKVTTFLKTYYTFTKENVNISSYAYFIPATGLPNGTYWAVVSVTSNIGTNSTSGWFFYSNAVDTDGDGLSDFQEQTLGTLLGNPDSDGDGFFDGMEVFHGSDPLDPDSVIPEPIVMYILTILCTSPLIYFISKKKNKIAKR